MLVDVFVGVVQRIVHGQSDLERLDIRALTRC